MLESVKEALTHVSQCETQCQELEARLQEFRARQQTAEGRLDGAERAYKSAAAKHTLGECSDDELLPLQKAYGDAQTEAAGLPGAVDELERRLQAAEREHESAERAVMTAIRPFAAEYAENHRQRALEAAEQLGHSMSMWSRLELLARGNAGGFLTGENQVELLGNVADKLRAHRVWGPDRVANLYVRHDDDTHEMSVSDFIEYMGLTED